MNSKTNPTFRKNIVMDKKTQVKLTRLSQGVSLSESAYLRLLVAQADEKKPVPSGSETGKDTKTA